MRIRSLLPGAVLLAGALSLTSACGSASAGGAGKPGGSGGDASEAGGSGGSGGSGGGAKEARSNGGSGGSASDGCNSMVTADCNKLAQCSPFELEAMYGDLQTCIARMMRICTTGAAAPGEAETPAQMAACAAAVSQQDCAGFLSQADRKACDSVGSLADGKPCAWGSQCQTGYCKLNMAAPSLPCGVCAERTAAGKTCSGQGPDECQSGLVCNSKQVCAQPVQAGGACAGWGDCASGLVCASGTCSPPLAPGQPCSSGECNGWADAYCNSSTHVCEMPQLADPGQPCGAGIECSGSGHCLQRTGGQGICQAPAPDGAPCDLVTGPLCLQNSFCVNGRCTFWDPALCK